MLLIKGIFLLLSHLPTSHTNVRAVRHTEVSFFYTSRCVASCFQPSLRDTSLLSYCRIPSYRFEQRAPFGHLTKRLAGQHSFTIALHDSVLPYRQPVPQILRPLLTSHNKLYSIHGTSNTSSSPCVRMTSSDKNIIFPSYTYFIYTYHSEQLQDFELFRNLIHGHMPCRKILFVRSDVCQLHSDFTSR